MMRALILIVVRNYWHSSCEYNKSKKKQDPTTDDSRSQSSDCSSDTNYDNSSSPEKQDRRKTRKDDCKTEDKSTKKHRSAAQEQDFHFRADRWDNNNNAGSGHQNGTDIVRREHFDAPKKAEKTEQFESRGDRKDMDDHGSQEGRKRREAEHDGASAGVQNSNSRNVGLVEEKEKE